jgi:dinuclear metal center YbgI/SA1388 family protein
MKLNQIIAILEEFAPTVYQESYDNAGLICGDTQMHIGSALISLDVTEKVVEEAIRKNCNLIIAHHPIVFGGLKKITGKNYVERTLVKAIKNDVAIYAAHTNLDAVENGVNDRICAKLNLQSCKNLDSAKNTLKKLVTFVPKAQAEMVREALFAVGAGYIGNYDHCSFNTPGEGSFRALEKAMPFVGDKFSTHFEPETRVETIFPMHLQNKIVQALITAHPYEEVAYDIYSLDNLNPKIGIGKIGLLPQELDELDFLNLLKSVFKAEVIRYTALRGKKIRKVALCGGSGAFLLPKAIQAGADIFISADFKYHQFFDADNQIIIADIGHYESEQFTKEIFYDILSKKIPNFVTQMTEINTNPINYI